MQEKLEKCSGKFDRQNCLAVKRTGKYDPINFVVKIVH